MPEILGALFYAFAAYVGILLASGVVAEPFDDGPAPGKPPLRSILVGAALLGIAVVHYNASLQDLLVFAVVVCALSAIWCTDVRFGLVPDIFTLVPLGFILTIALMQHHVWSLVSAVILVVPFAIVAVISKGRGLGWGDVKLAALGGAVLGASLALLVFSAGCLIAVIAAYVRGRARMPIAFAPYLAASIAIAMPLVPFSGAS